MRVQGPNVIEQTNWMIAINWTHSLLHEDPRPKSGKSRLNLRGTILEEKSIGSDQKEIKLTRSAHDLKNQGGKINRFIPKRDKAQKESSWFEEPRCKLRQNSRIQFASNESKFHSYQFGPWTPSKVSHKPCIYAWLQDLTFDYFTTLHFCKFFRWGNEFVF